MQTVDHTRKPNDDGAVLVLVLVFVVVVGLLTVALLQQSGAGVVAASTARRVEGRVLAVNGGVDAAVQMLRADSTLCATPGSTATLPSVTLNGNAVTLTCTGTTAGGSGTGGSAGGAGGWAVFLNRTDGVLRTQGAASEARTISGPVYNHNTGSGAWDLNADVVVSSGDVLQRGTTTTCPATPPNRLTVQSPTPALYQFCTGPAVTLPAPTQALDQLWPGASLPANAPARTQSGSGQNQCTVFSPGRYTSAPSLSGSGVNYLRNGVYFFDNIGTWTIDDWVLGGTPGPGESRQSGIPATCAAGDGASGAISTGVVLLFGGNSRIALTSGGRMELHSPRLIAAPDLPGVSIFAIPSGLPSSSPFRLAASTVSGTTPLLQVSNNGSSTCGGGGSGGQANGSQLVIHGNIYVPEQCVVSGVTGSEGSLNLRGGIVAGSLELRSSASVSNGGSITTGTGSGSGQRRVVITATSAASTNNKQITATAVVAIANDTARTTNVMSWVVANP